MINYWQNAYRILESLEVEEHAGFRGLGLSSAQILWAEERHPGRLNLAVRMNEERIRSYCSKQKCGSIDNCQGRIEECPLRNDKEKLHELLEDFPGGRFEGTEENIRRLFCLGSVNAA